MENSSLPHIYQPIGDNYNVDYFWVIIFVFMFVIAIYGAYIQDHSSNIHLDNKKKLEELLVANEKTDRKIDLILEKLN